MFKLLFEQPLYNALIVLMKAFPMLDLGLIIILFTVLVKLILSPLSIKALYSQYEMKKIEPLLKKLKKEYPDDKQALGIKTMELYKEHGINPFSSLGLMVLQIPILFALYFVLLRSGLPEINNELLYSFISAPSHTISTLFLGMVDVAEKSLPYAMLAAAAQYFQTRYSLALQNNQDPEDKTFAADFARSMNFQMTFILPLIMGFISYKFGVAIALYFITSSVFQIGLEWFSRKKRQEIV